MIHVTHHFIEDIRHRWPQLARVQDRHSEAAYMAHLKRLVPWRARCFLAWDAAHVVGTIMTFPAGHAPLLRMYHDVILPGVGLPDLTGWTNIYVDRAHRGLGISRTLAAAALDEARDRGETHVLFFGYETPEIESWIRRLPGARGAGLHDAQGAEVVILPVRPPDDASVLPSEPSICYSDDSAGGSDAD